MTTARQIRNNFISGAVALSASFAFTHPIDSIKTRMQAAATATATTATATATSRGFVTSVCGAGPQGGLRLSAYEATRSVLASHGRRHRSEHGTAAASGLARISTSPVASSALAAVVGDTFSSVVKVPREVVTSHLQAGTGAGNFQQTVRHILHTEGARGLYRGFWAITARDWPFMTILFSSYELLKGYHYAQTDAVSASAPLYGHSHNHSHSHGHSGEHHVPREFPTTMAIIFGGLSGGLAGFITTPADVIKTKVMLAQNAQRSGAQLSPSSAGVWRAGVDIVRSATAGSRSFPQAVQLGTRALFVGAVPRSVWWTAVCSIFFVSYETMKRHMATVN
ncbi:mitochondrial carrier [Ramicandelaber brevisporus]|nr:mitochondrial carrier [Ramicandelaber brevisporus]